MHFAAEKCGFRAAHDRIRSRPGKPNQRKGQNEKFMNFAHFCEFWCFSLGKQARFTLNFCSGTPLRKVHELTFLWFGLPGPLLISAEKCGFRAAHDRKPQEIAGGLQSRTKKRGVLAKGVSVGPSVTLQETKKKKTKDIGPSSTFGTQTGTAKEAYIFAETPFQKPTFLGSRMAPPRAQLTTGAKMTTSTKFLFQNDFPICTDKRLHTHNLVNLFHTC